MTRNAKGARLAVAVLTVAAASAVIASSAQGAVLHDQLAPAGPVDYTSSQNFEPALDNYDGLGADDFVIPSGAVWRIDRLQVKGSNQGSSVVSSANVFLFADGGALPGAPLLTLPNVARASGLTYPDLDLPLSGMPILPAGHYWIGVQANLTFTPGSNNWFWRDRSPQYGKPAAWRQPGDGFGDGCVVFIARLSCPSYNSTAATPDQAFRLEGATAPAKLKVLKAKARRGGKVLLKVSAPDLGRLEVRSSSMKAAHRRLTGIGPVKLVLKPRARTRAKLGDGKRVKAKFRVTLKTSGGSKLKTKAKARLKP